MLMFGEYGSRLSRQAIISLADVSKTDSEQLSAAFNVGGEPLLITIEASEYIADFVIATTSYDSGLDSNNGAMRTTAKRESESVTNGLGSRGVSETSNHLGPPASNGNRKGASISVTPPTRLVVQKQPLFRPNSQDEDSDDEFGGQELELDDAALTQLDALEQQATQQISSQQVIPVNTNVEGEAGDAGEEEGKKLGPTQHGDFLSEPGPKRVSLESPTLYCIKKLNHIE